MRTRDLGLNLPPYSLGPVAPGGEEPRRGVKPGDFLLSRAHGTKHRIIKWGQSLRMRDDDRYYAGYTHAALVVSSRGRLIEAVGEGVRETSLRQYVIDYEVYQVVHITASDEARQRVVEFAEHVLRRKAPYAALATVSTTFWAFTGSRLLFFMDGSFTCSGLVARSLERMGATFDIDPARVTPAQLALFFQAPPPPENVIQ